MNNRVVYIYALSDPRTAEVRYVGKTVQLPELRLQQHIYSTNYYSKRNVVRWLSEIVDQGLMPEMHILEVTDELHWEEAEIKWIAYYRSVQPNLTNHHRGGKIRKPFLSRRYKPLRRKPKKRR